MSLLTIYTALLMRVREGLVKGKKLWHLYRSTFKLVDELQLTYGRWMKPIQHYQAK